MHGNVWEWCEDDGHPSYAGAPRDGSAWTARVSEARIYRRIQRGGAWGNRQTDLRSAYRQGGRPDRRNNDVGFRVARTLSDNEAAD
jgi:formylglycine-generating enzyme required for sulfatase activity